MHEATLIETRAVRVDEIKVSGRLRPASPASVASLKASVAQLGHVLAPVILRRKRGGQLVLIGGLTRLTAVREMGRETIRADVWKCSDDWARMAEIDENLAGGELSMLERAIFFAERKRLYVKLHPETAKGTAGAVARWENASDTVSFASAMAEKLGMSKRHVERLVALGETIEPDAADTLMTYAVPHTYKDLMTIGGLDGAAQRDVALLMSEGRTESFGDAVAAVRKLVEPPKPPPEEAAFRKLAELFDRAPMAARRRFLDHIGTKHAGLLPGGADG